MKLLSEDEYRRQIAENADRLDAHVNLALLLQRRGADDEARILFERAAVLAPENPVVLSNLGALYRKLGQLERARERVEQSLRLAPDRAAPLVNLGLILSDQGCAAEALPHLERAVERAPTQLDYHDSLLLPDAPRAGDARAHARGAPALRSDCRVARAVDDAPIRRRSRSGSSAARGLELSAADLRRHSVAFFVEPLLAHADRRQLMFVAYSGAHREDEVSAQLAAHCVAWHRVAAWTDDQLAAQIRADGIDLLIDLSGHSAGNRLALFARGAAPAQLTYLGYPDRTGCSTIDWRVTDAWADPVTPQEEVGAERPLRVAAGFLTYQPFPGSPPVGPPPSTANAPVTFGSFNVLNKIDLRRHVGAVGARPSRHAGLAALPQEQRVGRCRHAAASGAPARCARHFAHPRRRRRLFSDLAAHLGAYGAVDVALDTFPYHGTTTTCDALWMGVPVVSLVGESHVARVSRSLLSRAGSADLLTTTPDDYVRVATELAGDVERRRQLRASARERLDAGGLTDGKRGAASFAAALREAWRHYLG